MKRHLKITDKCIGSDICRACESVQPGIIDACSKGTVVVQEWATMGCKGEVSRLIESCPCGAIVLNSGDEKMMRP